MKRHEPDGTNGRWPGKGKAAYWAAFGLLLLLLLFACGALLVGVTTAVPQAIEAIIQETKPEDAPAETEVATTPTPVLGLSRSNPYPSGSTVTLPHWEVTMLEAPIRGARAWAILQDANMFNEPPPEGYEYLLLHLRVVNRQPDEAEKWLGVHVTGSANVLHYSFYNATVPPAPILETWLPGNMQSEGWNAYTILQREQNLQLFIQDMDDWTEPPYYLALTAEQPLPIFTAGLAGIVRTDVGAEQSQPAGIGQITTSANWEAQLLQVVRGAAAWQRLLAANRFNDLPEEGFEFVLVQLRIRYIGSDEGPHHVSRHSHFAVRNWYTEEWQRTTGVAPKPELEAALFPGGEVVGWLPLPVAVKDTDPILRFMPDGRVTSSTRYFLLRSDGR